MENKIKVILKIIFIITLLLSLSCSNKKAVKKHDLPDKVPLKIGNAWIYKNLIYTPNRDTVVTYDTVCVVGKYKDYYEYATGYGKLKLVKNESGKFLSFGYIQLADTIHGSIFNSDTFYYKEPRIINSDTLLFRKPELISIFNSDTGYIDIDTAKYSFPNGEDSLYLSIEKNYKFKDNYYDVYVIRHNSSCFGVYRRYEYFSDIGEIYMKAISKDKKSVVQEMILDKFIQNYHFKNLKSTDNIRYF